MKEPLKPEAPVRLCCGDRHYGGQCADGMVQCCLCLERFSKEDLNTLEDGTWEDVCIPCADYEQEVLEGRVNGKA